MRDGFKRKVRIALDDNGWKCETEDGMLMLLELMVKHQNRCYNSCTENGFLNQMKVMTKDKKPNKLGREFMMHMLYASSNQRPPAFNAMLKHRS